MSIPSILPNKRELFLLGDSRESDLVHGIMRACVNNGIICTYCTFEEFVDLNYCFEINRDAILQEYDCQRHPFCISSDSTMWLMKNPQWVTFQGESQYFQDEKKALLIGLLSVYKAAQVNYFDISKTHWSADMYSLLVLCSNNIDNFKIPDFRIDAKRPDNTWQKRPGYPNNVSATSNKPQLGFLFYHLESPQDIHIAIFSGGKCILWNVEVNSQVDADKALMQLGDETADFLNCDYLELLMVLCDGIWHVVELRIVPHYVNKIASHYYDSSILFDSIIRGIFKK